jgi:aldehyde:ferredoxin oxidoreductase
MYGLHGKILQVNLSNDKIEDKIIPEDYAAKFIGGKGLALKLLMEWFSVGTYDALSEENPVIYMTGPFTNFGIPGSGRHVVISKSPLTGYLGESYSGGFFGTHLKRTGYDGIIITGKSDSMKFLIITDEEINLEDAEKLGLLGKFPAEVEDILKVKYGDLKISSIGPAGERLVKFASIINDRNRANGRCGLGAVMGYKNLKAIGVGGSKRAGLFNEKEFKDVRKKYIDNLNSKGRLDHFGKYGTANLVTYLNERGILPTKNFKRGTFDNAANISGDELLDRLLVERDTCSFCPVRCKRVVAGEFGGQKILPGYGGPEYETLASFGSLLNNDNLEVICLANQKCNQYGLDTISTGNVIAYAMEASERNIISEDLKWGDAETILTLIDKINQREGLGQDLGEGVKRFSQKVGGNSFAVQGKGLETPMHEPRGKKGLGMSYVVSPRGCTHLEGLHDTMIEGPNSSPELGAVEPLSRFTLDKKIQVVKNFEDVRSFTNSLIQCVFTVTLTGGHYNVNILRDLLYTITGEKLDLDSMLDRGSLFFDMGREYSYNQGLRKSDDDLPERFKKEELEFNGQTEVFSEEDLERYIDEYYSLRNWDSNGRPKRFGSDQT